MVIMYTVILGSASSASRTHKYHTKRCSSTPHSVKISLTRLSVSGISASDSDGGVFSR